MCYCLPNVCRTCMPRLHVLDFGRNTVHDNYNYDIFIPTLMCDMFLIYVCNNPCIDTHS